MFFGTDYYPEHWDESVWQSDLRLMKDAHFNMIRISEFAWSRLEPREGDYDFSWLDRFLDLCSEHDLLVMMGIPARNVPAWLIRKHPDLAVQTKDGLRESFGSRYTICLNHPQWAEHALRLARQMTARYAGHPAVHSWHLDNEYGDGSICYCQNCRSQFIEWLKVRYGSVENLNSKWGLVFWSLELSGWEDIWLPAATNRFAHNPSLLQDYRRFFSETTVRFVHRQAQVCRRASPGKPITTNLQSMTRYHTDYHQLARELDVVATNYYPPVSYQAADLDLMRSLKGQNFWVVEQKSGPPGFAHPGYLTPEPGETRMYTYQSIGHGADAVLYFRWRPANFGQEQFHKGILDYDSKPNRIFREISQAGSELDVLSPWLVGTTCHADVAILFSYDARWALESFYPHPDLNYRDHMLKYYQELQRCHVMTDLVDPQSDLSAYKVVVAPLLYLMDQAVADRLAAYVAQGGTLVYTFRSGLKDENNNVIRTTLRPVIQDMLGLEIEESFALAPEAANTITTADGRTFKASLWIDLIKPRGAEVVARYDSGWYQGYPAVTVHSYGQGTAYMVGTYTEDAFFPYLMKRVLEQAAIKPLLAAPDSVEVLCRSSCCTQESSKMPDDHAAERTVYFLLNHAKQPETVNLPGPFFDILGGRDLPGPIVLEPFGVCVLARRARLLSPE